jgi:probable F420-dependent oxidoreductase
MRRDVWRMMAIMRTFRFLGIAAPDIVDARGLVASARRAESMGFDALVMPDHLLDQHAPVPALATVAAATEKLRIGTFVLNVGLRHPAVLAQDLASLDVLSGGRLEIGIGAGWNRPEHDAVGLPFDPLPTRLARLREALVVLKGCFAAGTFSFAGEHYTITSHDGRPKPVQQPHPPVFLGGGGRRLLTLAAQEADIVGLAPRLITSGTGPAADPRSLTAAATEEKVGWIRAAAGDRFDRLELNCYPTGGPVVITNNPRAEAAQRADQMRQRTGVEITVEEVLESPHVFIGSVDDLTHKILELRERFGISSIMTGDIDEMAGVVERLAGT